MLTPYGVAIRYPNEFSIEEYHVQEALIFASEIVKWTEKVINSYETKD